MSAGQRLRDLLAGDGVAQLPAVYDGITARAAETAGFPAVFVSGNGVAASLLGSPDVGLVTMTESVAVARALSAAVSVPVLHDGDSGYGGVLQVTRLVRELEAVGAAGLTLEDQETPKRCGLLDVPPPVVEEGDWLAKVEAAVEARRGDTVVVARTDALRSRGLATAVRRAEAAAGRGADAVLVVGLHEPSDVERVAVEVAAPLVVLVGDRGPLADLGPDQLAGLGVALAVYPATVRSATAWAALTALQALRRDGTSAAVRGQLLGQPEWDGLVGLEGALELERRFR